jgi:hypothetical protein
MLANGFASRFQTLIGACLPRFHLNLDEMPAKFRSDESAEGRARRNAIATVLGRPAPPSSSCAFPSCALAATFPGFREPRRMAEEALTAVIQEDYIQGISTS